MLYFEHQSKQESENEHVVLQYFGSELGKLYGMSSRASMYIEEWGDLFSLSACLAVKQNWKSFQTGNLLF